GLRHILPILPFLAVIAAGGVIWLINHRAKWAAAVALAWLCAVSLAAHPDYLSYFNAFAGDEPQRIAADSDLDWGQDSKGLAERLRDLNVSEISFPPSFSISTAAFGFPPRRDNAWDAPDPGWNAVGISQWKQYRMGLQLQNPKARLWPDYVKP